MANQQIEPDFLVIGEVLRPHGVRGEVRMRVLTDNRDQLLQLDYVYLADSPSDQRKQKRDLDGLRFNKSLALLSLAGIGSRDDAERVRDKLVLIDMQQAAPLEDGQYYLFQLIGMRVVAGGTELGSIREVLQTGANDVYIVDSEAHGELLIPAHDETITAIDFDTQVVTMTLPEGLLAD